MGVLKKFGWYWYPVGAALLLLSIYLAKALADKVVSGLMDVVCRLAVQSLVSSPTLLTFVVLGGLIIGARLIGLEIDRRPKIDVRCGADVGLCRVKTPINEPPATEAIFWRVQVVNRGFKSIKNCSGLLHKIERDGKPLFEEDNLALTWASKTNDRSKEDIRNGVVYYLGVLSIDNRKKVKLRPYVVPLAHIKKPIIQTQGTYFIYVTMIGDDMNPHQIRLQFNYTDNWETSELECVTR